MVNDTTTKSCKPFLLSYESNKNAHNWQEYFWATAAAQGWKVREQRWVNGRVRRFGGWGGGGAWGGWSWGDLRNRNKLLNEAIGMLAAEIFFFSGFLWSLFAVLSRSFSDSWFHSMYWMFYHSYLLYFCVEEVCTQPQGVTQTPPWSWTGLLGWVLVIISFKTLLYFFLPRGVVPFDQSICRLRFPSIWFPVGSAR